MKRKGTEDMDDQGNIDSVKPPEKPTSETEGDSAAASESEPGERATSESRAPDEHSGAGGAAEDSSDSDPFADMDRLRLSQNFEAMAGVKPVITTVAERKPHRQEFIRVRPGAEWCFETVCFVDKETNETYLVDPSIISALPSEVRPVVLRVAISRNSPVPFIWPVPLPSSEGRPCSWHESARQAARLGETKWVCVKSDKSASCYVPHVAEGNLPDPEWPADLTMQDLLRLAFRDRFIRDIDHPLLKRLQGAV
jgi:hypothetical protein